MILGFENFHPLKGKLTSEFTELCGDIVFRARALLAQRSEKEIFAAIEIINWMTDQSPAPAREKDEVHIKINKMFEKDEHGKPIKLDGNIHDWLTRRNVYSITYALKERQSKYDITEDESFPNGTWADFFAVLALALIDQASFSYTSTRGPYKDSDANFLFLNLANCARSAEYLIEAMDAVATAEGTHRFESGMAETTQKIKTRNQRAAIQRHSKTNNALMALQDFYSSGTFKSKRHAAQLFCEKSPEMVEHLAHYNRVRTLTEGLSKLLKGQRPSLQQ
ncbi:hypothetical protein [Nitrosovibrio tenuis]|uniref:Uncharacterized protein n=1 Tax=Nitrosovibrio tenuis TaxID=1233 RepID=A0A1H7LI46_9PROT|nr:hypothetical protein [Nitrosovibrio tenuis]SEK98591.1 hypothetical protein SAMN05216387_10471 [Nitrosovibrio tenuis]